MSKEDYLIHLEIWQSCEGRTVSESENLTASIRDEKQDDHVMNKRHPSGGARLDAATSKH